MRRYRSVLLSGASSGIGKAFALALAAPGVVLHLGGRDAARLAAVAAACRARGAEARPWPADVRDAAAMTAWVTTAGSLDLVIANAGISAGTSDGAETARQTRAVFAVNLDGVLNTVLPALAVMRAQPADAEGVRGRIAVMASIAAFLPAPGAPAYCAAKAAVDTWTVATAAVVGRLGIRMTSLCPGYIRTPMTEGNQFPMPGLMDADHAVRIMLRGIAAGRTRVVFPWWLGAAARLIAALPPALTGRLLRVPPGKAGLAPQSG